MFAFTPSMTLLLKEVQVSAMWLQRQDYICMSAYHAMESLQQLRDSRRTHQHLVLLEFLSNLFLGVFEGHRPSRGQWAF